MAIVLTQAFSLGDARGGDFNPEGRRRRSPSRPVTGPAQPARPAAPTTTEEPASTLIQRYLALLEREPGAEFPLERLAQLFRQRDGNLTALAAHFEKAAAEDDAAGRRAKLSLAGVYLHAGDLAKAEALYQAVLSSDPNDALAPRKLAQLLADRGDKAAARARLEPTLKLKLPDVVQEQSLRSLITWSLDLSDVDAARKYHAELVKKAQGSFFVRAELGRLLLERHLFVPAEEEYRRLVDAARGDNRTLAPALRDRGKALSALGKHDEALKVLGEAERAAGAQSGLRLEILQLEVEVYRAAERLPELLGRLEHDTARDFDHLVLLAQLYEETGQVDRARQTYETALARNPDSIEVRLKLVQLLELTGELDKVIRHYEKLVQIAPQNPDYAFRLAEAHLQRGEQQKALGVLTQLEARSRGDEGTLAALVDFYERVGEADRAVALLERLASSDNPRHLVELGDRYYAAGETERALKIWQRLARDPNDAASLHTLGDVFLDHDMPDQAIEALGRAMKLQPERTEFAKSYGAALERAGAGSSSGNARARYYREAQQLWEQLASRAAENGDALLGRESRQHIVTLWSLTGTLAERVAPLERRFGGTPPDLEAGRLLAETELRLRRHEAAEHTLRSLIVLAPGDSESHLRLERALVQQGKLDEAILVLGKLCELDPPRAKEYYQRMATYAAESYQDDRAISYAARAVELGPDDAQGHLRLGEMYRERQDIDHAIAEFRQALSQNDRLFPVHFALAELLLNRQEVEEADQLLRHVMRASPDEQLISRAARLSMQIHLGRGTLESLEKELLPIALSHPSRPIYRRLLVEIYGALAFPLANQAKSQDPERAMAARSALAKLGQRAVKPLLDALGDARDTQQRIAIELLSHIRNKSAGPTLLNFAASDAEPDLRLRAMIAAGALHDASLLSKFEGVVFKDGASDTDPVSVAAVWAIANLEATEARPSLLRLVELKAPTPQALAVLGLSRLASRRDAPLFASVVDSSEYALVTRAAAAFALAELGDPRALSGVRALAAASDVVVRATATSSLALLEAPGYRAAIAEALVADSPELVRAGVQAACTLGTGRTRPARRGLLVPDGRVDARAILQDLLPNVCTPDARANALGALGADIAEAAARAAQTSPAQARSIASALVGPDGQAAFLPLSDGLEATDPASAERARAGAEQIARAVLEPFLRLAQHPVAETRQSAIRWLASRSEPAARQAVLAGLDDRDPVVQLSALEALGARPDAASAAAVATLLGSSSSWSLRRQAAKTLGQMGSAARAGEVPRALETAALGDRYALVRDAAARALFSVHPLAATAVLQRLEQSDPEVQVKHTARELLDTLSPDTASPETVPPNAPPPARTPTDGVPPDRAQ